MILFIKVSLNLENLNTHCKAEVFYLEILFPQVELTWHPGDGLYMYIDGRRVDYQAYATKYGTPQVPRDFRTYFGRSLEVGLQRLYKFATRTSGSIIIRDTQPPSLWCTVI